MKRLRDIAIILLALLWIGAVLWHYRQSPQPQTEQPATQLHYAQYPNKDSYGELDSAKPEIKPAGDIIGMIASHHMYVADDIGRTYAGLRGQDIETVVIIGPNHFNRGEKALISKFDYDTPWGLLEADQKVISALLDSGVVENDEKPFEIEHSISSQVAFIKAAVPQAKVVPIILKRIVDAKQAAELAEVLNKVLPANALVVASVDFAHHTTNLTAQAHDKEAISILQSFSFDKVYSIDADSPPSLYTLLKYLDLRGAKNMQYKNTNAALVSGNLESQDVTSYVLAYFGRE